MDTLINIQGFYYFERDDSSNMDYCIMFYDNGLFVHTYKKSLDSLITYFEGDMPHTTCTGTYYLDKDTLKTQGIIDLGWLYGVYVIFKDYQITSNRELSFLKEYVLVNKLTGAGNLNKRDFKPRTYFNPGKFFPLGKKQIHKDAAI